MGTKDMRLVPLPERGTKFIGGAFEFIEVDRVERRKIKTPRGERLLTEYFWKMKCECGNEIIRKEKNIKQHDRRFLRGEIKRQNCGDLINHCGIDIGQKIGKSKVLNIYTSNKNTSGNISKEKILRTYAECICNCGEKFNRRTSILLRAIKNDSYTSCDTCFRKFVAKSKTTHGLTKSSLGKQKDKRFTMYHSAKGRAKQENVPFNIDIEDIEKNLFCPVLGIQLDWESNELKFNSPSLDKFYPSKGYIKGNVQVISFKANTLKNNGSPEEWIKIAKWCQKEDIKKKLNGF